MNKTATEVAEKEVVLTGDMAVGGFVQGLEFCKGILETQINNMASLIRRQNLDAECIETIKLNKGYHQALEDVLSNVGMPIAEELRRRRSPEP
ncbi:MAG: hypothetical protein V3V93_04055 [bacterium]